MENKKSHVKRMSSMDVYKGWGIVGVVFLHGIAFNAFTSASQADSETSVFLKFLIFPLIIFGSWASLFSFISGLGITYSTINQLSQLHADNKEDQYHKFIIKRLEKMVIRVIILLGFHFIWTFLFAHPTNTPVGTTHQSLITGSIRNNKLTIPDWEIVLSTSAFSMIAFTDLFVTITLCVTLRHHNNIEKHLRTITILLITGTFIILSGEIFQKIIFVAINEEYSKGNHGFSLLLTWIAGGKHSVFPVVGFGYFGAFLGYLATEKYVPHERMMYLGVTLGWIFTLTGSILFFFQGIPDMALHYQPFRLYTFNLGLQLIIGSWLLETDHLPLDSRRSERKIFKNGALARRWNLISLTIFMFEQPFSALFFHILNILMFGVLNHPFIILTVFLPIYMFTLLKLIKKWENHNFTLW